MVDKTSQNSYDMDTQVLRGSVRLPGRIVNPVQIRNGTATVCVEAPTMTKVGHWSNLRRLGGS